ncbi:hypothetical protein [Nonomuraea rhizosphaerae]|uniref:hypothetical protein n=1 Tax=Nonomuraea rhizosphaerae TaxID=2665663 RepID=UPI001C5FD151|nr:hypothetical protein [Nonomuraea rhizosphaerae]
MTVHEQALRHFRDLRDGDHGGATDRKGKEKLFESAVELLDPVARRALAELDEELLLGAGEIRATGVERSDDGVSATWSLTWAEQRAANVEPVKLVAHYGRSFHHPHLSGGTLGTWPLNVFDAADAESTLPTLRAIGQADVHNLVFQADYRIIPAMSRRE